MISLIASLVLFACTPAAVPPIPTPAAVPTPAPIPTPPPVCGNGVLEPGEACEPDEPYYSCTSDCTSVCGDGVPTSESCFRQVTARDMGPLRPALDFDGDGFDDLLSIDDGALVLHPGTASGQLAPVIVLRDVDGADTVVGTGDVDRDGNEDVILGGPELGTAILFGGDPSQPRELAVDAERWGETQLGDLDGDGLVDLFLLPSAGAWTAGSPTTLLKQVSVDTFERVPLPDEAIQFSPVGPGPAFADWNLDGRDEVLGFVTHYSPEPGLVGRMLSYDQGSPVLEPAAIVVGFNGFFPGEPTMATGDLDGDGCPEIVGLGRHVLEVQQCGVLPQWSPAPDLAIRDVDAILAIEDLDGDGSPEVVTRNRDHSLGFWTPTPDGSYLPVDLPIVEEPLFGFADVDGDGAAELITRGLQGRARVYRWDP